MPDSRRGVLLYLSLFRAAAASGVCDPYDGVRFLRLSNGGASPPHARVGGLLDCWDASKIGLQWIVLDLGGIAPIGTLALDQDVATLSIAEVRVQCATAAPGGCAGACDACFAWSAPLLLSLTDHVSVFSFIPSPPPSPPL
eukprot:gene29759-37970_t